MPTILGAEKITALYKKPVTDVYRKISKNLRKLSMIANVLRKQDEKDKRSKKKFIQPTFPQKTSMIELGQ